MILQYHFWAYNPKHTRTTTFTAALSTVAKTWNQLSHECMFLGSLSHHNKDLEQQTLKPSAHHSSRVLDKPCYSS